MRFGGVLVAFALCAEPAAASAQPFAGFPDVTASDFAIDLYSGAALGSGQIVGMGGAAVASAEGSAGMAFNPAAPAVRPATSNDRWDWDWHVDWLSPELGDDYDNNGVATTEDDLSVLPYFTAGIVGQYRQWALGVSLATAQQTIGDSTDPEIASFEIADVFVARSFADDQLVVGAGTHAGTFEVRDRFSRPLFTLAGASLATGAVWKPGERPFRLGASAFLPVVGREPRRDECDPVTCDYILPAEIRVPWRLGLGGAWRFAGTPWNRKVKGDWRDERAVLVAADVWITGSVPDGHGIEAFAAQKLQPSGRGTVLGVRAGAEYEWIPGRLRVRGGSYWEPARFRDAAGDAVPGRIHATFGIDGRIWSFCFWGDRYRVRASLTFDGARGYANGGASVGFWH